METNKHHPPSTLLRFFRWFCDRSMVDFIEGDLFEVYERRIKKSGKMAADVGFATDVLLLIRPGIIRAFNEHHRLNQNDMVTSYFKIGWRNLWRNKLYSALNITGLAFGIVSYMLLALYVFDELTFDNQHSKADRIYRLVEHATVRGESTVIAGGSFKLASEAPKAIPEVELTTRIQRTGRANLVDPENPINFQETVTVADEHLLQIFDFPLIAGDRLTCLKEPNSIIVNEDLAMRLFHTTDVMGKVVQFNFMESTLKITGVLKNHPVNSTFNFNSVMSESTMHNTDYFKAAMQSDWLSTSFSVYVLLRSQSNPDSVARKMTSLVKANVEMPEVVTGLTHSLQALPDVHLYSAGIADGARNSNVESIPQGNPMYVKVFSFTAVFVLLIAAINYTNLTTARASGRLKEMGVRKAIGAIHRNLMGQFGIESLLTTLISFAAAIILLYILLPGFNAFANKQLSMGVAGLTFWSVTVVLIIGVALLSGSYAAVLLTRMRPVELLKGLKIQTKGDLSVRKGLVIFQFAISTIMIIGTMVLFLQVSYMNNTDLGFNKDLMLVIDVNTGNSRRQFQVIKDEMAKVPAVRHVSVTSRVPGEWKTIRRIKLRNDGSAADDQVAFAIGADADFLATYEIPLVSGRNFNSEADSMSIMINEAAARMLNITEASGQVIDIYAVARNQTFTPLNRENIPFKPKLVGIVKDFHFQSLREVINPLVLPYNNNPIQVIDYFSVRIEPTNIQATLEQLKQIMIKIDAEEPFEYHFLDDQLALFYVEDGRRQTILGWVAVSAIFIACLGLFGLATYSAEQRLKEVGVRKVLGASVLSLSALLTRDFIVLVLIANVIAFPVAWWGANRWLQEFSYHIDLSWWIYVVAATIAVVIAMATVSYQAVRAAMSNPVNNLRVE